MGKEEILKLIYGKPHIVKCCKCGKTMEIPNLMIEERADDYCKGIFTSYEYMKPRMASLVKACYIDGATEQKAVDIEKACEWLEMNVEYWLYDDGFFDVLAMLKDFRKAMEE